MEWEADEAFDFVADFELVAGLFAKSHTSRRERGNVFVRERGSPLEWTPDGRVPRGPDFHMKKVAKNS